PFGILAVTIILQRKQFQSLKTKRRKMQWYYESSHFSKPLGDLVLNTVFNYEDEKHFIPDEFGVLLTSENIESHLAKIRLDQKRYEKMNQQDVKVIKELVNQYYSKSDLEKIKSQP
uniref:hypothetical protein n=1 Tax=Cyanothece sp. BG0011 TaxID=2082950 RepID=UPI0030D937AE